MPCIHHRNTGGEINVAIALFIPDLSVLRALGVDLCSHAHALGDGGVLAVCQAGHANLRFHYLHFFCKILFNLDSGNFR